MRKLNLEDFDVTGMSEVGQIILIKHIANINLLIDKENQFPSEKGLKDIEGLIPQSYKL